MTNELKIDDCVSECFQAQLWADVGGTFTDCFCVVDDVRRSIKVLSSGVVRGRLVSTQDDTVQVSLATETPADFWNSATFRVLHQGKTLLSCKVVAQLSKDLFVLEQGLPRQLSGHAVQDLLIELDPGLEAPVLAAHLLLGIPLAKSLSVIDIRLGTTRGTNALLTRGGASVGLVTTLGFGDCLEIGEQNRPDLFALTIHRPEPLTRRVIEADERLAASGDVLRTLDPETLRKPLTQWLQSGVNSLAICLLHSHVNDVHERMIAEVAREVGFTNISVSSQVAPMIKLVSRAETTVLDAYLTPILADYVLRLDAQFNRFKSRPSLREDSVSSLFRGAKIGNRSRLRLMTSAGNLVDAAAFRGGDSILSGPAGGVVALGKIADAFAPQGAIGLDMGGTSTDVCRYSGRIPRDYESRKAGVRVLAPMIAIHTVAAGGGSICDVEDGRMIVGPKSAGAMPGPACYGRGGPLTVTDLNVILGRLPLDRFPFPLDVDAARKRLGEVNAKLGVNRFVPDELAAEGFLTIAVTHMAEAVRTTSTAQGSDPRDFTLVGFGGAAGGHLCAIADAIGMTRIIDHRDASLLSALGMGLADVGRIRTRGIYRMLDEADAAQWQAWSDAVRVDAIESLTGEVESTIAMDEIAICRLEADVRYQGTEATLILAAHPFATLADRFHQSHRAEFGYDQPKRRIEIATIRCEATLPSLAMLDPQEVAFRSAKAACSRNLRGAKGDFDREQVEVGSSIAGPAIVVDDNSTLVIDPGWIATKHVTGTFELHRAMGASDSARRSRDQIDAVTVEVVARRMQGIADSMGETVRRTAASVNIRQRLDYSCAIFTAEGELIANAPHVPVHLGAMGHTVREIRNAFPAMSAGDVYVSNNPYAGGSHLPDVTVVTPVFCDVAKGAEANAALNQQPSRPDFYVASRAHHAEIGGKTPGSMPPDATCLSEEGVVIDTFALRRNGVEALDQLRMLLTSGKFPSRDPETNLADIAAQRAAGVLGCNYLLQLVESMGMPQVNACVGTLFDLADDLVWRWIASLDAAPMSFRDSLDDGTEIAVRLCPMGDRLEIDFSGTSPVHHGCFNATPAIVTAATIYVLRCVIGGTLPMNDGIMRRIDLILPVGLLNPPRGRTSDDSPAVVAGNVETSMRVVDCLLGALGLIAASQGTMNNLLIGDATFGYYETIGGGAGAGPDGPGASGLHTHMTNTRITDPEIFESRYPIRLWRFEIREGSGGEGLHRGGDGLIRELEFLRPLSLAMITNRRGTHRPWGLDGGGSGLSGKNSLVRENGELICLPAAVTIAVEPGDRLVIETPGGGGWGPPLF